MALAATEIVGFKLPIADSSSHWLQIKEAPLKTFQPAIDSSTIQFVPPKNTLISGFEYSSDRALGRLNSSYYFGMLDLEDQGAAPLVRIHQDIKKQGLEVNEDYIRDSSSVDVALEYTRSVSKDFSSVKLQYSEEIDEKNEQLMATFGIQKQNVIDILVGDEETWFKEEDVSGENHLQLEVIQSENGPVYFLSSSRLHSQRYLITSDDVASLQLTLPDVSFGERSVEVKQEGKFHFAIDARKPEDLAQHAEKNEFFIPVVAQVGPDNLLKPSD